MRFTVEQRFSHLPDAVAAAYADPELYEALQGLPKLSRPEVVGHEAAGDTVQLRVRYRFSGDLSAAVTAVVDPERLTWVEHSVHDLARRTTTFTMVPDHYGGMFQCQGHYRFESNGTGTARIGEGDIKVRVLLVGGKVERAIVSGLEEHLADEVPVVERYLGRY